jgi:Fe-S cluster assembly protein SufD
MQTFTPEKAADLAGPDWLRTRRAAAAARFAVAELPTEAEEIWRYSRISELDLDAYRPVDASGPAPEGIPPAVAAALDEVGDRAGLVVVVNGRVAHRELAPDLAARGVVLADLATLEDGDDLLASVAPSSTDVFTELNTAFLSDAVVVRVPAGATVDRPIVVLHWVDQDGLAVFPRTVVQVQPDAEATVLEHHLSADVAAFVDPVVELSVEDAARLSYVGAQSLGPRVWQTAYQASRVGRDGQLRSSAVALGGDYARMRIDSRLEGKGGTSNLTAVYFGHGHGMHDFRTMQDHAAPATTSDLLFKGAVSGTARSVYSGLIRVRKEARGTNAFQTNRNLVLSEGAGAESVPTLEIETGDVRCSHASAVGPVDEDQRYYLESRGVPPQVAERLIVLGFFDEVLGRLPVAPLMHSLRAAIAARLGERA